MKMENSASLSEYWQPRERYTYRCEHTSSTQDTIQEVQTDALQCRSLRDLDSLHREAQLEDVSQTISRLAFHRLEEEDWIAFLLFPLRYEEFSRQVDPIQLSLDIVYHLLHNGCTSLQDWKISCFFLLPQCEEIQELIQIGQHFITNVEQIGIHIFFQTFHTET